LTYARPSLVESHTRPIASTLVSRDQENIGMLSREREQLSLANVDIGRVGQDAIEPEGSCLRSNAQ